MAQGTPVSVATAEPSARAGSKIHYPTAIKNRSTFDGVLRGFALLMIAGATVAVWQFRAVEALARRSYEADQRSLLVMRVHLDVATFRETCLVWRMLKTSRNRQATTSSPRRFPGTSRHRGGRA